MQAQFNFPDTRFTFADFFAGAGGFSLGFIQAGMKCVSALEFNEDAAWTYWYNLCYKGWSHLWIDPQDQKKIAKIQKKWNGGETNNHLFKNGIPDEWLIVDAPMPCANLFLMDITKLEPEEWMEMIGVRVGDIKVFVGGPPCQGFSTSGKRDVGDERNKLALRMIYYAKVCQPDYVLIENVPGLLTLGRAKGEKESPFVHWIREAFDEAGYDMDYQVHNAADYGVPQNRKRVLFFAVKRTIEKKPLILDKVEMHTTVMEAIGNLPPIHAGETWKGGTYILHEREGYNICPHCLKYNQQARKHCHNCKKEMEFSLKLVQITE